MISHHHLQQQTTSEMLTMQQPTTISHSPLGMNVKSAMAANMGSSLFLFQGLHRISPYLLNTAAASSPSSKSAQSASYFRFELRCTYCRRGECPICLDYNSKIRIGYSTSTSPAGTTPVAKKTKKQARDSPDGVQILKLDLCSYSHKVTITRELISKWVGASYSEGDVAGSKPKEVDFDGLMSELTGQGVAYSLVSKDQMLEEEQYAEDYESRYMYGERESASSWESRTQRLSGSYQRHGHGYGHRGGHSRYGSGSSSSGHYRL